MSAPRPFAQLDDSELRALGVLADACLMIETARRYGLAEGGPDVHVDKCEAAVAAAGERGLTWTSDEVATDAVALIDQFNAEQEAHRHPAQGKP